ncbi:MAG: hypothetical protein LBV72_03275 [Tannerella sp.]|nr:hypothetical protein [Tannerella sp.]
MKQIFIIITAFIVTNAHSQSLEEKIAAQAYQCIQKAEIIDDVKYRECISNAMTEVLLSSSNQDDKDKLGNIQDIQNIVKKVDSILSSTNDMYDATNTQKELKDEREKYYAKWENESAFLLYLVGNELMEDEKYDFAIEVYQSALLEDSTYVPVLDNIAFCYKRLGDYTNTLKYYNKSLAIYPEGEVALINIGALYIDLSKFDISNKFFLQVKTLYPDNPEGYFGLAKNYLIMGDFDKGLENISIAHKIYQQTNSDYIKDAEIIIANAFQVMKNTGQENEFYAIAKKYNIKTDHIDK